MPIYDILAAEDVPHYGSFSIEAASPDEALGAATARLLAGNADFSEPGWDAAHSLRIVTLQLGDQEVYQDVALDPGAPFWPGPDVRAALLGTTAQLAQLIASLGEAEAYPGALEQVAANLTLLGGEGAADLFARRDVEPPDRWIEAVEGWALDQR